MELFTLSSIIIDLPYAAILFIWVYIVVMFISKKFYELALKNGFPAHSATYFGRKVIHLLAGGLVAILLPFLFHEPVLPFIMAVLLTIAVYLPHKTGKLYIWFQDPNNMYEVDFTIAWGLIAFFLWFLNKSFWLAIVPILFMAWGDGVTGIVRNLRYKRRIKAWEGSLAMLLVCLPIGAIAGWAGIASAFVATLAEKQKYIDDNIAVPLVTVAIIVIAKFIFPAYLTSLYH